MPVIIPMPYYYGHSAPMTDHDAKVLAGCFIVLSLAFLVTSVITVIKYLADKKAKNMYNSFINYFTVDNKSDLIGFFHIFMVFSYGILILVWLGTIISNHL